MMTTRQAAKKLGISAKTLSNYIAAKKVFSPKIINVGGVVIHSWSDEDVERLRQLLPKIANGRKTRYQKKQSAVSNQQPAKAKPKKKK
jgi:predicted DNA-binding transcriptional regulator AlpA